jgi:hypothetical protein
MATDRAIIKEREAGQAESYGLASTGKAGIAAVHTRQYNHMKTGTENGDTNVAEVVMFVVNRKGKVGSVKYLTGTTAAANATHYTYFTVQKRTAGAAAVVVASYNTHTSAQGAITGNVTASLSIVAGANSELAAGDTLHYQKLTVANGVIIGPGTISVDIEEI